MARLLPALIVAAAAGTSRGDILLPGATPGPCPDGTHGLRCDYGDDRPECEGQYGHICVDDAGAEGPCAARALPPTSMVVGAFVPQCTADGYYEAVQCHGSTGYCHCSRLNGTEVADTTWGPRDPSGYSSEARTTYRDLCQRLRAAELRGDAMGPDDLLASGQGGAAADRGRGAPPPLGDRDKSIIVVLVLCALVGLAALLVLCVRRACLAHDDRVGRTRLVGGQEQGGSAAGGGSKDPEGDGQTAAETLPLASAV